MTIVELIGALNEQIQFGGKSPHATVIIAHEPKARDEVFDVFGIVDHLWTFSNDEGAVFIEFKEDPGFPSDEPIEPKSTARQGGTEL